MEKANANTPGDKVKREGEQTLTPSLIQRHSATLISTQIHTVSANLRLTQIHTDSLRLA